MEVLNYTVEEFVEDLDRHIELPSRFKPFKLRGFKLPMATPDTRSPEQVKFDAIEQERWEIQEELFWLDLELDQFEAKLNRFYGR